MRAFLAILVSGLLTGLATVFFGLNPVHADEPPLFPDEAADAAREPAAQPTPVNKKKQPKAKAKSPTKSSAKSGAKKKAGKAKAKPTPTPTPKPKTDAELLQSVDSKYQTATAISMKVDKTLKIGLLGEERKSSGSMWISSGRIRMELEGNEKSMLVVNNKDLWAVTFPGPEFPDASVQVIRGDATSKKGQSKNAMSLLSVGGFLKLFKSSGVKTLPNGTKVYSLLPKQSQSTEFKKAEVTLTPDGGAMAELKYWDPRDNETIFLFHDVNFGQKEAFGRKFDDKLFEYQPPKNAEVMNL